MAPFVLLSIVIVTLAARAFRQLFNNGNGVRPRNDRGRRQSMPEGHGLPRSRCQFSTTASRCRRASAWPYLAYQIPNAIPPRWPAWSKKRRPNRRPSTSIAMSALTPVSAENECGTTWFTNARLSRDSGNVVPTMPTSAMMAPEAPTDGTMLARATFDTVPPTSVTSNC